MSSHTAARLAWTLWVLSLALTILSLLLLTLSSSRPGILSYYYYWMETTAIAVGYSTVGAVVASRLPGSFVGWLFCTIGLLFGVIHFCGEYAMYTLVAVPGSLPAGELAAWIDAWIWVPSLGLIVFLLLVFPDGRLPGALWRRVAWFTASTVLAGTIIAAFSPGAVLEHPFDNPLGIEGLPNVYKQLEALMYALIVVGALSMVARMRQAGSTERQQIKWFAYATTVSISGVILKNAVYPVLSETWVWWVGFVLATVGLAGSPVAMGFAILRYRLYEIDLLINRTLVYGALTASVAGIYVLVVGALGTLFKAQGNLGVSLLATGAVALLFQPLRGRLQRGVNRLMYGERDDPYAVISRLGERLEATPEPRAMLPTIVETVAQALKLPYVAIALKQKKNPLHEEQSAEHVEKEGFAVFASWGSPVDYPPLRLPLSYGHEIIGELILAPRTRGEGFAPAERRLLEDLARQTEVAAYAVRLAEDLQRAREQLVSAREEERRRLRRDLHDGVGPQLSGQALTIDAIRSLLERDPEAAEELLVDLKTQTRGAAADIRRLVYALRPPALDSLGLVGALRSSASRCERDGSLRVDVEAPEAMPPLPAAVEVACYRIAEEALTNVVRHAEAQTCALSMAIDEDELRLELCDDGRGLPDSRVGGVGLTSMRERAAELGGRLVVEALPEGGTAVRAELPLPGQERWSALASS